MPGNRTIAGALLIFGAAQFLLIMAACEAMLPGYSVRSNMVSDLGIGPTAGIFNSSLVLLGACAAASSLFLLRHFGDRMMFGLLGLAGAGAIGAGIFPENTGLPHVAGAVMVFFFGASAAIWSARRQGKPLAALFVALGILSLAALALFFMKVPTPIGAGGMERMIKLPMLAWMIAFGGSLLALPEKQEKMAKAGP